MEEQELKELIESNIELEKALTKRNEQYIFDLKKSLKAGNLSEELQAYALSNILPEMIEGQKTGKTARQLFGTVTERTQIILDSPAPRKEPKKWEMWVDNTLLLFAFLNFLAGVMPLLTKTKETSQQGILTLIIGSVSGGYAFYLAYKYVYRYDRPGVDQAGRPGTFKSLLIMMGIMLVWMLFFLASAFIPPVINPTFDPVINISVGVIAFGIRYLLKKKYGFQGSVFSR